MLRVGHFANDGSPNGVELGLLQAGRFKVARPSSSNHDNDASCPASFTIASSRLGYRNIKFSNNPAGGRDIGATLIDELEHPIPLSDEQKNQQQKHARSQRLPGAESLSYNPTRGGKLVQVAADGLVLTRQSGIPARRPDAVLVCGTGGGLAARWPRLAPWRAP